MLPPCYVCGGSGEIERVEIVPECCGHYLSTGECCGEAVPGQRVMYDTCPGCGGERYIK